jgi:2-polyprenyl-3-methyl-5-hydroxy-6-metoxy-1,4-benzoquinol methylase
MNCREKKNCICCDSDILTEILDLTDQPLANSYHLIDEDLDSFPLKLNLCNKCFHLQLSHIVNPDLLFKNYLYVSGTTKTLRDYFEWFVKFVTERTNLLNGKVLDIACNDGTQLDCFKKKGWKTYGVEPAENLHKICSENHEVKCGYFDENMFTETFDVIIAQNVFAHNENAKKFLDDCEKIMNDNSVLFIQTSQSEMIVNNQFDTIYHEHLSFFNVNSFNELTKRTKLNLIDVIKTPVHGISYVFILSKKKMNNFLIQNHIDVEKEKGLLKKSTYDDYKRKVYNIVNEFREVIESHRSLGFKIVGYGAAAKGMTFLNFAKVRMDFIIDDNELKQNLYTPGTDILILPVSHLSSYMEDEKVLYVPLAWNFFDEIKNRIKIVRNNNNDLFLKYFPEIKINN